MHACACLITSSSADIRGRPSDSARERKCGMLSFAGKETVRLLRCGRYCACSAIVSPPEKLTPMSDEQFVGSRNLALARPNWEKPTRPMQCIPSMAVLSCWAMRSRPSWFRRYASGLAVGFLYASRLNASYAS
jgi:hypothetical protein